MRVLLVSPYDLTHPGGVTSHVFDLAHEFHAMGHEATVVGPAGNGVIPQNGFTHHIGGAIRFLTPGDSARVSLSPFLHGAVRELLAAKEFDVFHLHEPFLGFLGASFLRLGRGVKIGTFHTWREGPHLPYIAFGPLVRRWNRLLDGRVAVSETARRTVSRYVPGEYRVIPNGVPFESFFRPMAPPARLAEIEGPIVLFVGRIEARKGIPYLLEAFQLLKRRQPRAHLVVVGEGGLLGEYKRLAAKLGLQDVIFTGAIPRQELPGYYQRADIFCSPSIANESFGIALLEAMAAGTPCVATTVNGYNTLGRDGDTGLIVPPRDAPALAEAIERLLVDRDYAGRLAAAAQERARLFDWPVVAQSLIDYYEEVGA